MKTQLRKPRRALARYTKEYKQEALELWRASGRSAAKVASELGIRPPVLYRWACLERLPRAVFVIYNRGAAYCNRAIHDWSEGSNQTGCAHCPRSFARDQPF